MRAHLLLPLSLLLVAALASCNVPASIPDGGNTVRGSGNVITQTRQVSGFTAVALSGAGDLQITQTGTESLSIEAEDNVMPLILTAVTNGKLNMGFEPNVNVNLTKPVVFHLTVKDLRELDLSGAATATIGTLTADTLTVSVSGAGSITCTSLATSTLTATLSGAAKGTVSGAATSQTVTMSGAGNYQAADFLTKDTTLHISGAGNAIVAASATLNVDISGVGTVEYIGSPKVTQQLSGAGTVRKRG
ncbi:MAG TPA: head GIN domain-containing protein [Ktedonobacterales bacterium]